MKRWEPTTLIAHTSQSDWIDMFPLHWFICGGPPKYNNWLPQIDFPKGFDFVE